MAGRGPVPKRADQRARRNSRGRFRSLAAIASGQPDLPEVEGGWPQVTRDWWRTLAELPLAEQLTSAEWSFLVDTALLHRAVWARGELKYAAELRLRLAKFALTPEDRARMQLEHVAPSTAQPERPLGSRARDRYRRSTGQPTPTGDEFDDLSAVEDEPEYYAGLRVRTNSELNEGIL